MDTNVTTPFPLIHVDLNHEPCEFFFHDHPDQCPASRYTLLPQTHPHRGTHHPDQASLVEKLIIAPGGPRDHPLKEDLADGKNSIYGHDHDHGRPREYCPAKWMSSKTRIMKKMTGGAKPSGIRDLGSDPNHEASSGIRRRSMDVLENDTSSSANSNKSSVSWIEINNNNPTTFRVCTDCNTTKTPLWRSGPTGPKSLCNACGIRQRKARRAMAAAAAAIAANGESLPQPNPAPTKVQQKKKKNIRRPSSSNNDSQPMKKLKTLDPPVVSRNLCFEEFVMKLSKWISDFRGVFPQDEKEAAILLMALSYGLFQADNLS